LPCTYLAHHEPESVRIVIIIISKPATQSELAAYQQATWNVPTFR